MSIRVPEAADLQVALYDLMGREVGVAAAVRVEAGLHSVPLDASALAVGVYLARVSVALDSGAVHTTSRRLTVTR